MKTIIKISLSAAATNPSSASMTRFMKAMAFNPNVGRLSTWLFRLPLLKLPSIRPAQALYNNQYLNKEFVDAATLLDIFPRAVERRNVVKYFLDKKISQADLENALMFVKFFCTKIVNSSPVFRSHFGDPKVLNALIHYVLYGQPSALTTPLTLKILETLNEESAGFNPKSLDDVNVGDLKSGPYSEIEVAARLNRLTKDWFAATGNTSSNTDEFVRNRVHSFKREKELASVDKNVELLNQNTGKALSWAEALKSIQSNVNVFIRLRYTRLGAKTPTTLEYLTLKYAPSFFEYIKMGTLKDFYKAVPDLAGLCVLCTPQLSSALNEYLGTKNLPAVQKALMVPKNLMKEAWMARYVGDKMMKNSRLPTSEDAHLWMKVQALPSKEVGPWVLKHEPKFTIDDIQNLRILDIERIATAVGIEKSLTTVFSDLLKEGLFKRKFLSAAVASSAVRQSPFGAIPKAMAVKNAKLEDDTMLSMKSVNAWIPIKVPAEEFQKKILRVMPALLDGEGDSVQVRAELNTFMSNGHSVDFDVIKYWSIPLSPVQLKHLKAAQADPDSYVIRDGFHGTSIGAAGAVLLSGFRMTKAFVKTAQSMGAVLYIAPNIDKSLQYIGASFGREEDTTGIIFRGDLVVKGKTAPDHATGEKLLDWTYTRRYATEEIGLVHPNTQYLVHSAYLVRRKHSRGASLTGTSKTKFAKPVPALEYEGLARSPTKNLRIMQRRVIVKVGKDEWHTGFVSKLLRGTGNVITFDDGATATIRGTDLKDVHLLAKDKVSTIPLTDIQANKLI